jgi:YgiT-type zinc finger domain-containing protein
MRYLTRSYGKGLKLLVIENVPVVICAHCGESYLTAETLHELERIKLHRRSLAKRRNVAVANFV